MQNNIFIDTFKTLGTNAVPMSFGSCLPMETKTVSTGGKSVRNHQHVEVLRSPKYLSVTRHAYTRRSWCCTAENVGHPVKG